jgi:hypothetical protein
MNLNYYIFDIETYPNCFLFGGKFRGLPEVQIFEISTRRNDREHLRAWLDYLKTRGVYMVGYNNIAFDNPIIEELIANPYTFDHAKAFQLCQTIIRSQQEKFGGLRVSDRTHPQVDLLKLNHFDNPAKRTRLKDLQFAMRSASVEDLPFEVRELNSEEMDVLRNYNAHDITETEAFLERCIPAIEMRKELIDQGVLRGDVLNYSDVKIGTEFLIAKIGRQKCFISQGKPRQTYRSQVAFKDVVLPKIEFYTKEFSNVLDWFKSQTIYTESSERPKLETQLAGLSFHFGVGGVHASVENSVFRSSETHIIKDIDVSGMYVAVAIANGFYPEHLGQDFVTAYRQLQRDRALYPKGTMMNAVLKLAGNGVYGNSNNPYSPFYDPKYLYSVTTNGQLQILQLVEALSLLPDLKIIQANTDGITAYLPRSIAHWFHFWCQQWEEQTGLKLEEVDYDSMHIADVNNYVAVTKSGKVKRKGRYWYPIDAQDYEGQWHKDFSSICVQKAAEQAMLHKQDIFSTLQVIANPFDFMLRYKTPAGARVLIGDKEQLKTVRYYVSTRGETMKKISTPKGELGRYKRKPAIKDADYERIMKEIPPGTWDARIHTKNKSKYDMRSEVICSGFKVKQCNKASDFDWNDVDWNYYQKEVEKILIGVSK